MRGRTMWDLVVVHRRDRERRNIGDVYAAPTLFPRYFPWLADATTIDVQDEISTHRRLLSRAAVIYGGGGLFGTSFFGAQLRTLIELNPPFMAVWGAGHNQHDGERIVQPALLQLFDLVGIRDYGFAPYEWAPCTSCLLPQLERPPPPRHEVVVYHHWSFPVPPAAGARPPELSNGRGVTIDEVIAFLASGEVIVTSSYHGAYWGTLLGRRVVVARPFSTKFYGLRHPVPMVTDGGWRAAIERSTCYPDALEDCRDQTLRFGERLKRRLGRG